MSSGIFHFRNFPFSHGTFDCRGRDFVGRAPGRQRCSGVERERKVKRASGPTKKIRFFTSLKVMKPKPRERRVTESFMTLRGKGVAWLRKKGEMIFVLFLEEEEQKEGAPLHPSHPQIVENGGVDFLHTRKATLAQDKTGKTRQDKARQTRQSKATQNNTRQDKTPENKARQRKTLACVRS
jgi:hypothetical protein